MIVVMASSATLFLCRCKQLHVINKLARGRQQGTCNKSFIKCILRQIVYVELMKAVEINGTCSTYGEMKNAYRVLIGTLKGNYHLENLGVHVGKDLK
jgi:hypothetical protein